MFSDFFIQQIAQSLKDEQKKLPPSEAPFSDVRLEEAEPPNSLTKSGMLCCLNVHYLIHSFTIHSLNKLRLRTCRVSGMKTVYAFEEPTL